MSNSIFNGIKKSYLIILILALVIFPNATYAQTPTLPSLAQASQTWKCLQGNIPAFTFLTGTTPSITQPVQGDGFPNTREIFLVACAPTAEGNQCTSGNKATDLRLFNIDNTAIPVTFKEGPVQISTYGKVSATAIVSGTQAGSGKYDFYGVFENAEKIIGAGDEKAQQQETTIDFEGSSENCVSIAWANYTPPPKDKELEEDGSEDDPYGVVFDSQSLEPLKGAVVVIYDSNKKILNQRGLANPQTTKEDGLFNFLVPQGTYYLDVYPKTGYTFSANPKLNKNAGLVYIKNNGKTTIYKPGEAIDEKIDTVKEKKQGYPDTERRNIPFDPGTNSPSQTLPVSMLYSMKKMNNKTEIFGRVSHPFTHVSLMQSAKILTSVFANHDGFYTLTVNNSIISATEKLEMTFKKTDLTGDLNATLRKNGSQSWLQRSINSIKKLTTLFSVYAQATSISLDPILSRIIGYAYNSSGKIIPNATINVLVLNSKKAVYTTKADAQGYFTVPAKNIPPLAYTLEIISPQGEKVIKTTSNFAKDNREYLTKNNIKLNSSTNNTKTKKDATATDEQETGIDNVTNTNNATTSKNITTTNKSEQPTPIFYILIILLLILITAGVGTWFYLKKKKSQNAAIIDSNEK